MNFQHRDLHENNVCVNTRKKPSHAAANPPHPIKYGRSGWPITLIDYGLSRAKLADDEVVFFNFEEDKVVFQQPNGEAQFDAYRT